MLRKSPSTILIVQIHFIYLLELDGFIEEKNGSKYLNIVLTDSNNVLICRSLERNQRSNRKDK